MAKFLCHATVHTNFLEKKILKEKKNSDIRECNVDNVIQLLQCGARL